MNLFACLGCPSKDAEITWLREQVCILLKEKDTGRLQIQQELRGIQKDHEDRILALQQDCASRIQEISRECADRVMSRSYTEYAVGHAAESVPRETIQTRSDEEEWMIEERRRKEIGMKTQMANSLEPHGENQA